MSNIKLSKGKNWIAGLDTIRFALAFIVVLSHTNIIGPLKHHFSQYLYLKYILGIAGSLFFGIAAVIAFFIISGIVIHFPYRDGKKLNISEFYLKRSLRITIPMIIIAIIAYNFNISESEMPFWSLYCELIYYALYPIFYFLIINKKINSKIIILASFGCSYFFLLIEGSDIKAFLYQTQKFATYFHHFGISATWLLGLPCWLLGVLIAQNLNYIIKNEVTQKRIILIRFITYLSSVILNILYSNFGLSQTLSMGLFSLLAAYWISLEISYWNKKSTNLYLEKFGKWSYSLYLCHMIPLAVLARLGIRSSFYLVVLQIPFILLISYLFYLLIEKPSHNLIKKIRL
ncbi:acyltransferase family protein [Parasediminibacterium paludis]|uniref:Acyltransferase family protein n=1 Tax=Parasediminibacterium paludis TaxID=908966 RepID=A0ABV8Q1W2_9BACT